MRVGVVRIIAGVIPFRHKMGYRESGNVRVYRLGNAASETIVAIKSLVSVPTQYLVEDLLLPMSSWPFPRRLDECAELATFFTDPVRGSTESQSRLRRGHVLHG